MSADTGPFDPARMGEEGRALLKEMEEARKKNDLGALKATLEKAKKHEAVNQEWVENAFKEIEMLSAASANASSEGRGISVMDVARQCKEQGNKKLKEGTKASLKEAGESYTRGIALLKQTQKTEQGEEKESTPEESTLLSQLYSNRAQVLLQMREFSGCVDDCRKCLKKDPKNVKAYYRGARASLHNGLYQQSIDFCVAGLEVDSSNQDLVKLKESAEKKLEDQRKIKDKLNVSPQELMDQQENVQRLGQQVSMLRAQIQQKTQRRRSQELTKSYISALPSKDPTYVSCGKAFIHREQQDIQNDIKGTIESIDAELPKMEKAFKEINERYEKAQKEFQEIVKYLPRRPV